MHSIWANMHTNTAFPLLTAEPRLGLCEKGEEVTLGGTQEIKGLSQNQITLGCCKRAAAAANIILREPLCFFLFLDEA